MGKIRVKSFGDQEEEEKAKKLSAKRADKKAQKNASKDAVLAEDTDQSKSQESENQEVVETEESSSEEKIEEKKKVAKKSKFSKTPENLRSQNYLTKVALIEPHELYSVSEGLSLLGKAHMAKFDETVELHINTLNTGISGSLTYPHSSGKTTRVAIASDEILAEIEKGKINFDILIATPSDMPKLGKVAKILGPRGLMPNPKNGTISTTPEVVAKKYEGGLTNFKTESKAPIIHLSVGKISLGNDKLSENIAEAIKAVKKSNIRDVTLKSTMSPGIKIKV